MFGRDKNDVIETLPMVPLRDVVVFPHMMIPFVIGRQSSIRALDHALARGKRIFLSAQHDATRDNPGPEEIYTLGTVCSIVQSLKLPDGNVKVLVEGLDRARALEFREEGGSLKVVAKLVPRSEEPAAGMEGLMSKVIGLFEQYVKLSNNLHYDAMLAAVRVEDPGKLADTISSHLVVPVEEKQNLLEIFSAQERLTRIASILEAEVDKLTVDRRIQGRVKKQMERAQKEYYLNEKMKAIQKELGRKEDRTSEADELRKKVEQARMPKDAEEKALAGAEAPGVDAPDVRGGDRLAQLPRLADRRPLDEEDPRAEGPPGGRADPERGPLRPREGEGAHRRVPGRAPAGRTTRRAPSSASWALPAWARPRSPARSRAAPTASSCGSRWAACATRPRSAATGAPTSAPSPGRSSR